MEDKKLQTRTGFLKVDKEGELFRDKEFDNSKVTNTLLVSGSKEDAKWTQVRAWNEMGDYLKENAEKNQKWELKGDVGKDEKGYEFINVKEAYQHTQEKAIGEVRKIDNDKTKGGTDVTKIFMTTNEVEHGKSVSKPYNVELYGDKTEIAKDLKVGDKIEVEDWARNSSFEKDGKKQETKTFTNPRKVEITGLDKNKGAGIEM